MQCSADFSRRRRTDLVALQQSEVFGNLDLKVQILIKSLTEALPSFDEIKTAIRMESQSIKEHVTENFEQQRRDQAKEQYYQQCLESLQYTDMFKRREAVDVAHQKIFQWIYESSGDGHWDNFSQWLAKGEGIYWLSGKPGSGKSTLMSYVYQDDRTPKLLRVWVGEKKILTPCYFFWSAGSTLQKSSEGLLRSLLFQILQRWPDMVLLSLNDDSISDFSRGNQPDHPPLTVWTKQRLYKTFQRVITEVQKICRICIFIDGLDETSDDPNTAISVIQTMLSADLKVCLASRRDHPYADAFDTCAKLRLQDLTERDIENYVWDKMKLLLENGSQYHVSNIVRSLVRKAQGIFLWINLVIKTLITGLTNEDSLEQLQSRIDSMPSEIEALYARMLSNINQAHHQEAVLFFQLALPGREKSLLNITLALYVESDDKIDLTIDRARSFIDRTRKRVPIVCAGLLEIQFKDTDQGENWNSFQEGQTVLSLPHRFASSTELKELSYADRHEEVVYIHRTAMDFLHHNKEAHILLEKNERLCRDPHSTYVRALLAKVTLLGFPEMPTTEDASAQKIYHEYERYEPSITCSRPSDFVRSVPRKFMKEFMENVVLAQERSPTTQTLLCKDVGCTLTTVYQKHQAKFSSSPCSLPWSVKPFEVLDFADDTPWDWTFETIWLRDASRSSSMVSFHSAESEPVFCSTHAVDFLGLAARWGLSRYVLEALTLQQEHFDGKYMTYLLCLSVLKLWQKSLSLESTLQLIRWLLTSGANSNMYIGDLSNSIWGQFLINCCGKPSHEFGVPETLSTTLMTFIESGADINVKTIKHDLFSIRGSASRYERSALHMIRKMLFWAPELKHVEETIIAMGGHDSHRYTHVRSHHGKGNWKLFALSEKQSDEIIKTLEAYEPDPSLSPIEREHLRKESLRNIFNELERSTREAERDPSLEEDVASHSDAEEDFCDAVSVQSSADEEDGLLMAH